MSTPTPPPPPPSSPTTPIPPVSPEPEPRGAGSRTAVWQVATAIALAVGLVLAGVTYLAMDQRVDDLRAERDAAREELAEAQEESESSELGGLEDLLGEGGLEGLLGGEGGGLEDLLGDLGGMGDLDPVLLECLGSGGLGLGGGGDSIPDGDLETQVAAIQQLVEEERGLPAGDEVDIEFVSLDEVQRRAVELTQDELDPQRAAVDSRLLAALGAVEPGTDLVQAQLDALDAGVGGFYNPETQQLVIGSEEMDGLGALVTAHELVHAQADAAMGLPDQEAIALDSGSDAAYAALNAIEGDASLYSQQFIGRHLPLDELLALQEASGQTSADLDALPHFVARQLEFPYVEGMTFTCDVFLDGGWEAVDRTYTEVPTTTAQILFPDRYHAEEDAVDVRDPAGLDGWEVVRADTFGAADLLFLLEAPGDDENAALSDPKDRVAAWAGGEVAVWGRGEDTALTLVLADRGEDGATPLCDTVTEFYPAAFPDAEVSEDGGRTVFTGADQSAVVACSGSEVALGIGPDPQTAAAAIG
ncbi:hypothetical protein E1262_28640 [Jiangella aurantiaca]|uniref:Uncharacterized protein n=1 Tax=Jiangella aurantiaca TaxID=2530373 RepID=A0A4R4ZYH6_9ACTN|nr:hypothetical protein [Jiangella aurantiaca]TDD64321.1 hypothetical protein E1262_28640 [Jiangella aurantiaca]